MVKELVLPIRKRINKEVKGVKYWKYYVDIPTNQIDIIQKDKVTIIF